MSEAAVLAAAKAEDMRTRAERLRDELVASRKTLEINLQKAEADRVESVAKLKAADQKLKGLDEKAIK